MSFRDSGNINGEYDQSSYEVFLFDYRDPEIIAAVKSGNIEVLRHHISELPALNQDLMASDKETLFELAFTHGKPDTIKFLLTHGVKLPNDQQKFHSLLVNVFHDGENIKKDPKIISELLALLKANAANPEWMKDSTVYNKILATSASYYNFFAVEYIIDNKLASNINSTDNSKQHSTLYYIQEFLDDAHHGLSRNSGEVNITELKKKIEQNGASLSGKDADSLQVINFTNELMSAIENGNKEIALKMIAQVVQNHTFLTQEQFNKCLYAAIQSSDPEYLQSLINSKQMKNNEELLARGLKHVKSEECAKILIDYIMANPFIKNKRSDIFDITRETAHRVGLSGTIETKIGDYPHTLKLEGASPVGSQKLLIDSLEQTTGEILTSTAEAKEALRFNYYLNHIADVELKAKLLEERFKTGKLIMSTPSWVGHCLGMALKYDPAANKTYIALTNRGLDGLDAFISESSPFKDAINTMMPASRTGTIIYEVDGLASSGFLEHFAIYNPYIAWENGKTREAFKAVIDSEFESARPITILNAGPQAHGTCSYVNPKRSLEGATFIDRVIKGEDPAKIPTDEIYHDYKKYSGSDKTAACMKLVEFYHEHSRNEGTNNPDELDALNQLVAKIILAHHDIKQSDDPRELNAAKELYKILPEEYKRMFRSLITHNILPREIIAENSPSSSSSRTGLYSRSQVGRPRQKIMIHGDLKDIYNNAAQLEILFKYLNEKNITEKDILKIEFVDGNLRVFTKPDQKFKGSLRQALEVDLGAKIENTPGQYNFTIKNMAELKSNKPESRSKKDASI